MSNQATGWAIGQRAGGPSAKVVLWSIANYANDKWVCWPSQALIVEESEQSPDSVQRRIPDLEALGLLRRIPLRFGGRKTVDFYILPPSPLFEADLATIEPHLPRGCTVDPKYAASFVAAKSGSDKKGTAPFVSPAALPQTLPQPAENAAALVRQQEPFMEPVNLERAHAQAREERKSSIAFLAPDDEAQAVEGVIADIVKHWPAGAVGDLAKARAGLHDLDDADRIKARDAAPRFLRALKDENRRYVPAIATYLGNRDFERFPEPVKAQAEPSVELKPYVAELYAMLWKAIMDAVAGKGGQAKVRDRLMWLAKGVTMPAAALPSGEETRALVPIKVGSPECWLWLDWFEHVGIRAFPMPDAVPVIYVPSMNPPSLRMGWKGYHLAEPVSMEYRGKEWWWRLYQAGAPIEENLRDRKVGRAEITMGPMPTRAEAEAMIEIDLASPEFVQWEIWFLARNVRFLPMRGPIFVPSRYPPRAERVEALDVDALEEAGL